MSQQDQQLSWEPWDAGPIPSPSGSRIPCCCDCNLGCHCGSEDMIPGPGAPYALGVAKNEEKINKLYLDESLSFM